MNPFGLSGGQALWATVIVCFTVMFCTVVSARATVKVAASICEAVEAFSKDVADALTVLATGKLP